MALYYITSNKYSLQERILKNGKKVYDVHFRIVTIDGQEKQKRLCGYESKSLAKAGYTLFVSEQCQLTTMNVKKKKDPTKEKLLVGDLARQYMATLGNQNKYSVIYDKNNTFRIYILNKYDKTPIDNLTKEELYQWQDELWNTRNPRTGKYFSYQYLSKIRTFFSTFLTWVEQRYGIKNNFNAVTKPKRRTSKKEMKFWTREEFDRFLAVVDDDMWHAFFTFAFFTGRRKGELFALTQEDITPTTIRKAVRDLISIGKVANDAKVKLSKDPESMSEKELLAQIKQIQKKMQAAAAELNFELAAQLRDQMMDLKKVLQNLYDES
jgi:integrase